MRFLKFGVGLLVVFLMFLAGYVFYVAPHFDTSKVKSNDGVVSVLILGKGGMGHEAPDLTDTIISGFLDTKDKKIALVSLPRDIWVSDIRAKLNSAYYWGKEKNVGYKFVDEAVSDITGQNVNYHLIVDFSMFKDLIDAVGGIDVEVANSFTDTKYPIAGKENDKCLSCRYETIKFEKGLQTMNGETALKFVRSRNSVGEEGTDLAREARQQLVISALLKKVESKEFYLNPSKVLKVKDVVLRNLETDITLESLLPIAKSFLASRNNLQNLDIPEEFLKVSSSLQKYDYQYVFTPKAGDNMWGEFQEWLKTNLE